MHRKLVFSLALVGPLAAVLLTAPAAGALPLPPLPVPTVPTLPIAPPQLPLPQPPLPPLPPLPVPIATPPAVTAPVVSAPVPQLPLTDVTDTIVGLLAPPTVPAAPSAPATVTLGLPPTGSPAARTANDESAARGTGAGAQAQSAGGEPVSSDTSTVSAAPGLTRQVAGVPGRRVSARQSVRGEPVLVSTARPRGNYFGWFGLFMPFTGRDLFGMLHLALAALCVGLASMLAARRLPRPA
jgi:hypothetical protein